MVLRLAGLMMVVAAGMLEAQLVPLKQPASAPAKTKTSDEVPATTPATTRAPTKAPGKVPGGTAAPAPTKAPSAGKVPVQAAVSEQMGWLGFRTDANDASLVMEVAPDSPAARAGLRAGDRIITSDRLAEPVQEVVRLRDPDGGERPMTLQRTGPVLGRTYAMTVRRGDETLKLSMVAAAPPQTALLLPTRSTVIDVDTLEAEARAYRGELARTMQPSRAPTRSTVTPLRRTPTVIDDSAAETTSIRWSLSETRRGDVIDLRPTLDLRANAVAGAEFEQLNPALGQYFGGVTEGVFVLRVSPESPAAAAGLQPGDIVRSINGTDVSSVNALQEAIASEPGTLTLGVIRKGKPMSLTLRKE